ncbi:hypothetical protein D2E25_1858 [Bifidobacterium goeldii]|uniref:Lipoprotein n=1 Tax=Bifidobacterium goeldii TaxID=2306975 RepID=A0A430FEM3_9BIFI|nr:hypothetical protein [Bifidobacterium goeldii]RSX51303.1 hypothetical protein D2E25_1858 [Bifidobacterium goeldii]
MKRSLTVIGLLATICILAACGSAPASESNSTGKFPTAEQSQEDKSAKDSSRDTDQQFSNDNQSGTASTTDYIEQFSQAFASSGMAIENTESFDPQNQDSGHYQTEYRLGAYKGSKGVHGIANGISIDIVQYGGYGNPEKNTMLRVYLTGSKDNILATYPAVIKALDPNASDSDIQDVVSRRHDYEGSLGIDSSGSTTRIKNDSLISAGGGSADYVALIDADFSK